jgi:hypothetical protein
MDNNKNILFCRVCGLFLGKDIEGNDYFPWGEDGDSPSYDHCLCCGAEFGFHDNTQENVRKYREKWLSRGSSWRYPEYKPNNWSLENQLKNIPEEYR